MPSRPRITVELMDLIDDAQDRYRTDPDDPQIASLLMSAAAYALSVDTLLAEIVVVARRGTDAPRRKQLQRDRAPVPWIDHPVE